MSYLRLILIGGFAIFSMFFGSGNLVFPVLLGVEHAQDYAVAFMGLILTGVVVPFLGLLAMILYHGNRLAFFERLGRPLVFILTFAMLGLMGPFGVLPRCIIVAQGGIDLIVPGVSPAIFNALFCGIIAFLAWQRSKIIEIIGHFLTPWLLTGIVLLILAGVFLGPSLPSGNKNALEAFYGGLCQGYQTMDLLAAFFFSAATVTFIKSLVEDPENKQKIYKLSLRACLLGSLLLSLVYLGFVYLGAVYSVALQNVGPEKMLILVAYHALGPFAPSVVGIIIALACLTTAVVLASLFTDFLHQDVFKEKISRSLGLLMTLTSAYAFSLLGFSSLACWISHALTIAYPALIGYAVAAIIAQKIKYNFTREAFWVLLSISLVLKVLGSKIF